MGYDLERIVEVVDDELKCGICRGLLENPVQISDCEHIFCGNCIKEWLGKQLICPIDRNPVLNSQIRAAPKLITNLISKLTISCHFSDSGCLSFLKIYKIVDHINKCELNPKNQINCHKSYSMAVVNGQQKQIVSLESRVNTLENESFNLRKQFNAFKRMLGISDDEPTHAIQSIGKLVVKIGDKILIIDANLREPISTIKQKVQRMENIDSEEMLVFLSNKELDENKSLIDYRIYKLNYPLLLFMVKKKFTIVVRISRERQYPIELSPKDTAGDVLAKIIRKEGLTSKELVLSFRNQELDENRTLFSYKIRENNFVFLNTRRELEERRAASSLQIVKLKE